MSLYAPLDYLRQGLAEQEKLRFETRGRITDLEAKIAMEREYLARRDAAIIHMQGAIQRELKHKPPTNLDRFPGPD